MKNNKHFESMKLYKIVLVLNVLFIIISLFLLFWFKHHPIRVLFKNSIYTETTPYNFINVVEIFRGNEKYRFVNNGFSYMKCGANPDEYVANYIEVFADYFVKKTKRSNILMLGNATGSLINGLLYYIDKNQIDGVNFDVVEIDKAFTEVGEKYFNLKKNDNRINYFHEDARTFLNRKNNKKYDLIYFDIYVSISYTFPHHLITKEAFSEIADKLDNDGFFIMNVIGSNNPKSSHYQYLRQVYTQLKSSFDFVNVYYLQDFDDEYGNFIMSASKKNIENKLLKDIFNKKYKEFILKETEEIYTDNFSPVEKFL